MNSSQKTPPGYEAHLERAKLMGRLPQTPEEWEETLKEADELPGSFDLPEKPSRGNPPKK